MTAGISRGILELLAIGRLSATGAMTNMPHWPTYAGTLAEYTDIVDTGVHLNLTCGAPLRSMTQMAPDGKLPSLSKIIALSLANRLPSAEIANEINTQLDAYEMVMQRVPDFIDGHQHVHGIRGVQQIFVDVLKRRYGTSPRRPYIRRSGDSLLRLLWRRKFALKAMKVRLLSAGFRKQMKEAGFITNQGFAGYSDFNASADYASYFSSYLKAPGKCHLVMCHPGYVDEELVGLDPVTTSREQELAFLASDRFAEILAEHRAELSRLVQL